MKIQNINDVESFFKIIDQCKGSVDWYLRKVTAST